MCYFNMIQNVVKNCRLIMFITEDDYDKFKLNLYHLHMSKTKSEHAEHVNELKETYIIIKSLARPMTIL